MNGENRIFALNGQSCNAGRTGEVNRHSPTGVAIISERKRARYATALCNRLTAEDDPIALAAELWSIAAAQNTPDNRRISRNHIRFQGLDD
jgi:hypothetical protein